jgi:hypothetical protein
VESANILLLVFKLAVVALIPTSVQVKMSYLELESTEESRVDFLIYLTVFFLEVLDLRSFYITANKLISMNFAHYIIHSAIFFSVSSYYLSKSAICICFWQLSFN